MREKPSSLTVPVVFLFVLLALASSCGGGGSAASVPSQSAASFSLSSTPGKVTLQQGASGSTLIANALRGAANTLVAAEATPFVRLASYLPEPANRYLRARWDDTRRQLFENAFRFFAHYRTGEAERLVIKFASIDLSA